MAVKLVFNAGQLAALRKAISRSPQVIRDETKLFLTRGMAAYKGYVIRAPWRVGGSGGGAPVAAAHGGNLRDTHRTSIRQWDASLTPTAKYAGYVHDGTSRMEARPWLDYAREEADGRITELQEAFLERVANDFAR